MSKTNSRIARLDFWRANVSLFEDLLGRITSISCPWDSCPIFKSCLLKTELVHSKSQKDEQAWYKASIDEQDALNWPQIQKRSMQKVETGPGLPGWNIEILPKSAGGIWESQSSAGVATARNVKGNEKASYGKCEPSTLCGRGSYWQKAWEKVKWLKPLLLFIVLVCFFICKSYSTETEHLMPVGFTEVRGSRWDAYEGAEEASPCHWEFAVHWLW